jgi:hypothetical protein
MLKSITSRGFRVVQVVLVYVIVFLTGQPTDVRSAVDQRPRSPEIPMAPQELQLNCTAKSFSISADFDRDSPEYTRFVLDTTGKILEVLSFFVGSDNIDPSISSTADIRIRFVNTPLIRSRGVKFRGRGIEEPSYRLRPSGDNALWFSSPWIKLLKHPPEGDARVAHRCSIDIEVDLNVRQIVTDQASLMEGQPIESSGETLQSFTESEFALYSDIRQHAEYVARGKTNTASDLKWLDKLRSRRSAEELQQAVPPDYAWLYRTWPKILHSEMGEAVGLSEMIYTNALQTYPDFIASVLSNDLLGKSAKGIVLSSVLEATQGQAVKINFKQLNLE